MMGIIDDFYIAVIEEFCLRLVKIGTGIVHIETKECEREKNDSKGMKERLEYPEMGICPWIEMGHVQKFICSCIQIWFSFLSAHSHVCTLWPFVVFPSSRSMQKPIYSDELQTI